MNFEEWQINGDHIEKKLHEATLNNFYLYPESFWVSADFCLWNNRMCVEIVANHNSGLYSEIHFDTRLSTRFARFDSRLNTRFARFDTRLSTRFARFDTRLSTRFARFDRGRSTRFALFDTRLSTRFALFGTRLSTRFALILSAHYVFLLLSPSSYDSALI